jgi:hypothetical protein
VGRPLWREVGSLLCICCWPLPAQSFSGPSPLGLETIILLSHIWNFPFHRLLRLAGSRWRYSTPPPHGYPNELTNEPSFITQDEPKRDHHLEYFVCYYLCFVRSYETCLATCYSATEVLPLLTRLPNRCLAMVIFVTVWSPTCVSRHISSVTR